MSTVPVWFPWAALIIGLVGIVAGVFEASKKKRAVVILSGIVLVIVAVVTWFSGRFVLA